MEEIIHFRISHEDGGDHYICNQACNITEKKCTWEEEKVTCKNCLKHLSKKPVYMQRRKFKIIE